MTRYLEIYWLMVRNSLIREMSFKANFLLWMVVEFLWFLGQIVFIEILYAHVDSINSWSKWEVVLLFGCHQIISQIFQAFFYINIANLPELVRTGQLDILLSRPIDAQFAVSAKQFGLDNIVNALVGVGIVSFSLFKLGIVPSAPQIGLFLVALVFGVSVHYCVMFLLASFSFWLIRAQGLIHGYFNLFNIGRYPEVVFRGTFRFIFTWCIPIILVANVPAKLFSRWSEAPLAGLAMLIISSTLLFIATRIFWLFALRRYSSASS